VFEHIDRVVIAATGLDRLVWAGFGAETAVHADPEINLVAVDVERAVFARGGLYEDAAVGAGLGAGRTTSTALFEPQQVRARPHRDPAGLFGVVDGDRGVEDVLERDQQPAGDAHSVGHGSLISTPPTTRPRTRGKVATE